MEALDKKRQRHSWRGRMTQKGSARKFQAFFGENTTPSSFSKTFERTTLKQFTTNTHYLKTHPFQNPMPRKTRRHDEDSHTKHGLNHGLYGLIGLSNASHKRNTSTFRLADRVLISGIGRERRFSGLRGVRPVRAGNQQSDLGRGGREQI